MRQNLRSFPDPLKTKKIPSAKIRGNVSLLYVRIVHLMCLLQHLIKKMCQVEVGAYEIAGAGGRIPRADVARYAAYTSHPVHLIRGQ